MEADKKNNLIRPPIVVVLGHVDHGKTTLLDAIRKTNVASREAGGITQSIGASVITLKDGKEVTFIDTPGHAAFSKMRGRGGAVADIAVLVVAQDDGVKPQTLEALKIIRDAKIPFVVAGTKSDVSGTNPDALKGQLEKEQVLFEGRGGDTPFVSVSAKTGAGIPELLETLSLMADVAELKANPSGALNAVVIESGKDKMGSTATVVVRDGSITVGEKVYVDGFECKVRALFDGSGKSIKKVLPGFPARVFGFDQVPAVGVILSDSPISTGVNEEIGKKTKNAFDLRRLKEDEIPVVIKAGNAGALEAIISSLPPKIVVVGSGTGEVNSSDILEAKTGSAYVLAFESKVPNEVAKLADSEKVIVKRFEIIYELLQYLEEILKKGTSEELGRADVLASFPFNDKKVAGCKVTFGRISKGDTISLQKDGKEKGKSRAISLKKQKTEIASVGPGEEFGVILEPQLDFAIGDVIVSVRNGK